MIRLTFAGSLALLLTTACSSDNNNPPPPAIGTTQIDRMGRPAINTAVTAPFADKAAHDTAQDAYNASASPANWKTQYTSVFAPNLGILDSLDGNCGNQLAAEGSEAAGAYDALAGVLADDQLYLRTDKTTCALYLAVEADATLLTTNNGDCGGRTLTEDVIDESYSLLAVGAPSGVTDGVSGADTTARVTTTFPYLGAPH